MLTSLTYLVHRGVLDRTMMKSERQDLNYLTSVCGIYYIKPVKLVSSQSYTPPYTI